MQQLESKFKIGTENGVLSVLNIGVVKPPLPERVDKVRKLREYRTKDRMTIEVAFPSGVHFLGKFLITHTVLGNTLGGRV